MRRWRIILLVVALIVAVVIAIAVIVRPARSVKLPDGTILRIEKVTYGKHEPFKPPEDFIHNARQFIVSHLPKKWAERFPGPLSPKSYSGATVGIVHTNNDALEIWFSRWNPTNHAYEGYMFLMGELVDEHGCVLAATEWGWDTDSSTTLTVTTTNGAIVTTSRLPMPAINRLRFEAFPREQKAFRLRVYERREFLAEFTIANPAWASPLTVSNWPTSLLPVSVQMQGTSFTLKSLSYHTDDASFTPFPVAVMPSVGIVPDFEVRENGQLSTNWIPIDAELWDNFGNYASKWIPAYWIGSNALFLCPSNVTWRYSVNFCGLNSSPSASNATWQITGLHVPGAGQYLPGSETHEMSGVSVKIVAYAGIGEITYDRFGGSISAAGPSKGDIEEWFRSRPQPTSVYTVRSKVPYIAVRADGMTDDQRLTILVRDDKGREYYSVEDIGIPISSTNGIYWLANYDVRLRGPMFVGFQKMNLLPDSKTVDLAITIHNARTVDFYFKPPPR